MHHEVHGIKAFVLGCGGTLVQSFSNPERGKWPVLRHQAVKKTKWFLGTLLPSNSNENEGLGLWWVIAWRRVFNIFNISLYIYIYEWYSCFSLAFSLLRFECLSIATNSFRNIQNPSRLTKHSMLQLLWRTSHWDTNAVAPFCPHRRNRVEHAPACCAAHLFQEIVNEIQIHVYTNKSKKRHSPRHLFLIYIKQEGQQSTCLLWDISGVCKVSRPQTSFQWGSQPRSGVSQGPPRVGCHVKTWLAWHGCRAPQPQCQVATACCKRHR